MKNSGYVGAGNSVQGTNYDLNDRYNGGKNMGGTNYNQNQNN